MIPTMMLFGVLFGRWWKSTLVASAVGWPLLLLVTGDMGFGWAVAVASGLGLANAAVGVLIHQGLLWAVRLLRRPAVPR